jgi:lysophospholipase L1-like esterase
VPDAPLSPARRAAFGAVTAALGLSLGLGVLEIGARAVIGWRKAAAQRPPERLHLFQANPHGTGSYRLKPDLDLEVRVGAREVRIRTNSHGMPWREVEIERSDGRRRIAFLGDSFTFGCWADSWEQAFPAVFEANISRRLWEVMSFGVGGYGLADQELLLHEEVARFGPDYVIVAMFNGNDLRDTWLGLDKERLVDGTAELDPEVLRAKVPASELVQDTTNSQPCTPGPLRQLLDRSAAFQLAAPLLGFENQCLDFAANGKFTIYSYWSQHPYPPAALRARDATLKTLERIDAFLLERGSRLAIATIPTREQVHARQDSGPGYDIALPQAWIRVFARERGIPYLDLLPALREHVLETNERLFVTGDTHLNDRGHELAGRRMAEWFRCCVKNQPRPDASP